jgi:hypothetical protein
MKSSRYSYIIDILHHNLGGDVVKEGCIPNPKFFIPNLDGMNIHHVNICVDVEHGRYHLIINH